MQVNIGGDIYDLTTVEENIESHKPFLLTDISLEKLNQQDDNSTKLKYFKSPVALASVTKFLALISYHAERGNIPDSVSKPILDHYERIYRSILALAAIHQHGIEAFANGENKQYSLDKSFIVSNKQIAKELAGKNKRSNQIKSTNTHRDTFNAAAEAIISSPEPAAVCIEEYYNFLTYLAQRVPVHPSKKAPDIVIEFVDKINKAIAQQEKLENLENAKAMMAALKEIAYLLKHPMLPEVALYQHAYKLSMTGSETSSFENYLQRLRKELGIQTNTALEAAFLQDQIKFKQHANASNLKNQRDATYRNALHIAVLLNDIILIKSILEKTPGLINEQDSNGQTPVHYAAHLNNTEACELLISSASFIPDILDKEERSVLHYLAIHNNNALIGALAVKKPRFNIKDSYGYIPAAYCNMDIEKQLATYLSDMCKEDDELYRDFSILALTDTRCMSKDEIKKQESCIESLVGRHREIKAQYEKLPDVVRKEFHDLYLRYSNAIEQIDSLVLNLIPKDLRDLEELARRSQIANFSSNEKNNIIAFSTNLNYVIKMLSRCIQLDSVARKKVLDEVKKPSSSETTSNNTLPSTLPEKKGTLNVEHEAQSMVSPREKQNTGITTINVFTKQRSTSVSEMVKELNAKNFTIKPVSKDHEKPASTLKPGTG